MKTFLPPLTGTLAVFVLVLAIFVWRQGRAIGDLHMALASEDATAAHQREAQQRELQQQKRALHDAKDSISQLQRELAVARAAAGLDTERDRLPADPAMAAYWQRHVRRIVQERYGELFGRLNLSPIALEELKRLLVELTTMDSSKAPAADATKDGEAAPRRTPHEIHDDIYHLLGYEGYTTFDRYGRELTSARPMVRRFANDAADAGQPLSAVQRSALARAIFEVTDPQMNSDAVKPGAKTPDPATGLTPLDQQILSRAPDVLSSAQLDILRTFLVHEREGFDAWRNSLRAQAGTSSKPGDPVSPAESVP